MSTATPVPETWKLTGDDAVKTLRSCGRRRLLLDAAKRLRFADGFSHARSLAYASSLVLLQGVIAIVGLASALGRGGQSDAIVRAIRAAVPGPAGNLLTNAVTQAHRAGASQRYLGLIFGLVGALITGSTFMGQVERGLNRIYGVEQDRPTVRKYGLALALALTAGLLATAAFATLAFGRPIGDSITNTTLQSVWSAARWPLALVMITVATTALLRISPRRKQPGLSWLAFAATVSVGLWALATAALGVFFKQSTSFGDTYGPLAGIVALLVWALLSSIALLYGGAVGAQLEAVRAGASAPQDVDKVEHSEPDSADAEESAAPAPEHAALSAAGPR